MTPDVASRRGLKPRTTTPPQESKQSADSNAIRPFRVNVPEAELAELRRRLAATRWPSRELVKDRSQGVQLATLKELVRYSWVETVYPSLAYFNEVERGGHFAAWEEPALFAAELRAAFKQLR